MCPIRRNSLLVHVAYPQILGTNGLVVVIVVVQIDMMNGLSSMDIAISVCFSSIYS